MKPLVLASASPRRKALLTALGLDVAVRVSDAEELLDGRPAREIVAENAKRKAGAVAQTTDYDCLVIGADTLVELDGQPLSKPADLDEARAMIARLAGRTHHVHTGVAVIDRPSQATLAGVETTAVTFRELTAAEIDRFVEAVNPLDRAGAYTAEGPGALLVARFDGCYHNVLGLPLVCLDGLLREWGDSLFQRMDAAKAVFR